MSSSSQAQFFTRERANSGIKIPLFLPGGGKSEHWFMVRGVDSDHFRLAEAASRRRIVDVMQLKSEQEQLEAIEDEKRKLIAELVFGWSFEQPCTHENVVAFLREAPQIADSLDKLSGQRALFFASDSSSSQVTPSNTSDSDDDLLGPSKPSETA
jgi:hypothetical protein